MTLNFQALRALQAYVEGGSLAKAAARIHRTEPQVSRLLSGLQASMGFPILSKQGRSLVMTPEGKEFYERVAVLLQMGAEVQGFTFSNRQQRANHVRVVTAPHIAHGLLVDAIARTMGQNLKFTASIETQTNQDMLTSSGSHPFDVAITQLPVTSSRVTVQEMVESTVVAVMHADHPLAHMERVTVSELQKHRLIHLPKNSILRRRFEGVLDEGHRLAGVQFEASSGPLAAELASRGVGVALTDPFAALAQAHTGVAIRRFVPEIGLRYGILLPVGKEVSDATTLLVQVLVDLAHERLTKLQNHLNHGTRAA